MPINVYKVKKKVFHYITKHMHVCRTDNKTSTRN